MSLHLVIFLIDGVREFPQFPAIFSQQPYHLLTDGLLQTCAPVISVHNNVGTIFLDDGTVGHLVLFNHMCHPFQ